MNTPASRSNSEEMTRNRIERAAIWFAIGMLDRRRPIIPQLRAEFGLTAGQAVEALRYANAAKQKGS